MNKENNSGFLKNSSLENRDFISENKGSKMKNFNAKPIEETPAPQIVMDLPSVTRDIQYLESMGFSERSKGANPTFDNLLTSYKEISGRDYYPPPPPPPPPQIRTIGRETQGSVITDTITAQPAQAIINVSPMYLCYSNGNLYFTNITDSQIRSLSLTTGVITTVTGSSASTCNPNGRAVDAAGNVYFVDTNNSLVKRVSAGVTTTVAGSGGLGFNGDGRIATETTLTDPWGVAVDSSGNIFIADTGAQRIRRVDAITRIVTTVAGTGMNFFRGDGGLATNAVLNYPSSVAVDPSGNIFIADTNNNRIRRVDARTGIITTIAGPAPSGGRRRRVRKTKKVKSRKVKKSRRVKKSKN